MTKALWLLLFPLCPLCSCAADEGLTDRTVMSATAQDSVEPRRQVAGALSFEVPATWSSETPTSSMRVAQFRLPGHAAAQEEASLVVYYFDGGGGSVEANLERWAAQFEVAGDRPSRAALRTERIEREGLVIHTAALEGTYVAETSPGSGDHLHEPEWALLAAIVETPEGPYYLKLVGPAPTVEAERSGFEALIRALRVEA